MKFMSIDIGGREGTGIVVADIQESSIAPMMHLAEFKLKSDGAQGLIDWSKAISEIILSHKPDAIISCYPTRYYWAIFRHAEKIGYLTLFCYQHNIQLILENDGVYKKAVLGKGNAKKGDIAKFYKDRPELYTENIRDAFMFLDGYLILTS